MSKLDDLMNNGAFCTAPWVHIHSWPNGQLLPCCLADYHVARGDAQFDNLNEMSIFDAMNSSGQKKTREQMLNGISPDICSRCTMHERENRDNVSMRGDYNRRFHNERTLDIVENHTLEDGTLTKLDVQDFDIRFGNICNLTCRMCGHNCSSSWYEETVQMNKDNGGDYLVPKFVYVELWDDLKQYLDNVTSVYFAGGEPLLYKEHLQILDYFIEHGKTDVHLRYNTNLTSLSYKGKDIVEYWKQFPNVGIGASIDGMENVVEYIRTGTKWPELRDNLARVKQDAPHITLWPQIAVGVLNIDHIPEFWDWVIETDIASIGFNPNFITHPDYQNLKEMPEWWRLEKITLIEQYINSLRERGYNNHCPGFEAVVSYMSAGADNDTGNTMLGKTFSMLDYFDKSTGMTWQHDLPAMKTLYDRVNNASYTTRSVLNIQ